MSFLGQRGPGPLCVSGLLATKVRASGGALVQEWCAPGACWGCDRPRRRGCMSVERSGGCFRAGECRLLSANNEIGASSQLRLSCATSAGLRSSDACWKWCGVLGPRRDVERYGYQGFAQRQVRTSGVGAKWIGTGRMIGGIFELAGEIGAA